MPNVNGVARSGIVRLNSDGSLDTGFNFIPTSMPGLTNIVITHTDDDAGGPVGCSGKPLIKVQPVALWPVSSTMAAWIPKFAPRAESGACTPCSLTGK